MQDENSTSTSQLRSEEELVREMVSAINDAAKHIGILMKDITRNKGASKKLADKIDGKTVKNAEFLRQFSQIILEAAAFKLVNAAKSESERNGGNCKDALNSAAKQMGFDVEIIEFGGSIPED